MHKIAAIIVPYELGRLRQGVGCGPEHLIKHGAETALASNGTAVRSSIVKLDERYNATGSGEGDAAFELMRLVADEVRGARAAGEFPVVLAGSCFTAVGTVAGLDEAVPGVVWLDAHSDFSEPVTTNSGYMDSMGLSVLTGSAWQGMLATVPGARPLPESTIVLAGARAFDPSEAARLKQSRIAHLAPAELRSPEKLIDTVGRLSPEITGLYVHIDLDVLDRAVAGVNVFSEPGGLDGDQLDGLIAALMKTFPVRADAGDRVPPIAMRILETIAGGL